MYIENMCQRNYILIEFIQCTSYEVMAEIDGVHYHPYSMFILNVVYVRHFHTHNFQTKNT